MDATTLLPPDAVAELRALARRADEEAAWPAASWQALARAGGLRWGIPAEHGGLGLGGADLLTAYERLASACLTTAFILSQRDAAVRRIRDSGHDALGRELLPALAAGRAFATVGLSQLTTSRQHTAPALTARAEGTDFVLDGAMPWVTGAAAADHLVTGAVLGAGRQVLLAVPRDLPGLAVGAALELAALQGSLTAEVRCRQVRVPQRWLLAGPAEAVMKGTGGLETSALALGLAGAAAGHLRHEAGARPDLLPTAERVERGVRDLREGLHALAAAGPTPEAASALRARANTAVLRATQAALAASKGAGFLRDHPAQRWARQALFFLVWSCPRPALEATLAGLLPEGGLA